MNDLFSETLHDALGKLSIPSSGFQLHLCHKITYVKITIVSHPLLYCILTLFDGIHYHLFISVPAVGTVLVTSETFNNYLLKTYMSEKSNSIEALKEHFPNSLRGITKAVPD